MDEKLRLPVLQPSFRVLDHSTDYNDNTLTARIRMNGTFLEEMVCLDLSRPEHVEARELVSKLHAEVLRWRNEAATANCGSCVGTCCTSHWEEGGISLTNEDAERLAQHRDMPFAVFSKTFLVPAPCPSDDAWIFKWREDERSPTGQCCPMLRYNKEGRGLCTVYEHRPRVCREFPAHGCTIYQKTPGGRT